jgi:hypothetical protein
MRINQMREQRKDDELQGCTFHPQIVTNDSQFDPISQSIAKWSQNVAPPDVSEGYDKHAEYSFASNQHMGSAENMENINEENVENYSESNEGYYQQ